MKRKILQQLQAWRTSSGRNPLIIKGVRQCGKTFSLEFFGKTEFRRYFIINLEKQTSFHEVFNKDLNPKRILSDIAFHLNTDIDIHNDLLVLDEIQACPKALTSLKYFSEDLPELAICAAGSLLGLELTPASFPVGKVDFLHLHPMSFSEFLLALDDQRSLDILNNLTLNSEISGIVHKHLWERFKWYLITGGLPEVVKIFIGKKDNLYSAFSEVRKKQQALIDSYSADIAKHAGKQNAMHIERVFQSVPAQLARTQSSQAPRFQFANIIPGIDRYQRLAGAIDWLNKASLILPVPIVNHIEMPLNAFVKNSLFKIYCFDVGILGAMNELNPKTILDYEFGTYKGYFAENFIATQILVATEGSSYCWQKERAEVEFVTQFDGALIPIEVKAGHIIRAKSLRKYENYYQPKLSIILSGRDYNFDKKEKRLYCPLYLTEWLPQIITSGT